MIVDRALITDSMVIPGSSGSLQMVDHSLILVPLANVYLDSPYYKGHCKVMCLSSPIYPVIIGNVQTKTGRLKTREKLELGLVKATSMIMTTKVVIWLVGCSKRSPTKEKQRRETCYTMPPIKSYRSNVKCQQVMSVNTESAFTIDR